MLKKLVIIFCVVLLLMLCSCEAVDSSTIETLQTNLGYSQVKDINAIIEEEMSHYGFDYSIFSYENSEGHIDISITLSRSLTGANVAFADTIGWSVLAAQKANTDIPFELGELRVYFLLYDSSFDEDASAVMTFKSEDLETGSVYCITKNMEDSKVKLGATIEELQNFVAGKTG